MNYRRNEDKLGVIETTTKGLTVEVVTDLSEEPVTLAECKAYMRIDGSDEDTVITDLIAPARIICERFAGLSFGEKEITLTLDEFEGLIKLPYGPVASVDTVLYNDETGVVNENYKVKGDKVTMLSGYKDLSITYTTKALDDQANAPLYKAAVKAQVAFMYTHRGDEMTGHICEASQAILASVKVLNMF